MCEARTRAFIDFPPVPECVNEHVWFTCLYCNRCGRCGDSPDFWRVPWFYVNGATEEPLWQLICHNCLRKAEPSGTKEGAIGRWNRGM